MTVSTSACSAAFVMVAFEFPYPHTIFDAVHIKLKCYVCKLNKICELNKLLINCEVCLNFQIHQIN